MYPIKPISFFSSDRFYMKNNKSQTFYKYIYTEDSLYTRHVFPLQSSK